MSLINVIITDLNDNYNKLTTNQKIKILNVVKHKLIIEDMRGNEFQPVNIVYLGNGINPNEN